MRELIAKSVASMLMSLAELIRQDAGVEIVLDRVDLADAPAGKDIWKIQITTKRTS